MYHFELSEKLGMTVQELVTGRPGLGDGEFHYWWAKEQIEPSGERAADIRAGLICSSIANFFSGKRSDGRSWRIFDFLSWRKWRNPKKKKQHIELTEEQLIEQSIKNTAKMGRLLSKLSKAPTPAKRLSPLGSRKLKTTK